jgi:hypothetical protein
VRNNESAVILSLTAATSRMLPSIVYKTAANVQLRDLVQPRKEAYHESTSDAGKNSIIQEVVTAWSEMTQLERRFLGRFTADRHLWSEASEAQAHLAVQRMLLRRTPVPQARITGSHHTPSRRPATATGGSETAMVTPSPLKECPTPAHAHSDHSAPRYSAGKQSRDATFDFPFQGTKRGAANDSGRKLGKQNAKKVRSQGEPDLQPHDPSFDTQYQELGVLYKSDLPSEAEGRLQDPLQGAPRMFAVSGTNTQTPTFHVGALAKNQSDALCGADENHQVVLAGTGGAHDTMHVRPDELHAAGSKDAVTSSTGGRAFVHEQSLAGLTANLLLPSQHHRRQSSVDSTSHAFRCSQHLSPSPEENNRRPSPPRHARSYDQEDTQLPHVELTEDQFLELFRCEMHYDLDFEAGLASEGEKSTSRIKDHSRHILNACPIGNPGELLQATATSAYLGSQAFDGIENRPPGFALEALGGGSNSEVISSVVANNANLSGTVPSTLGRDDISYSLREFSRHSPGDRSACEDLGWAERTS